MLLPMLPKALWNMCELMFPEEKQFHRDHQQRKDEHEDGYPVDTMHVFHPLAVRRVRISFLNIEVFSDLA